MKKLMKKMAGVVMAMMMLVMPVMPVVMSGAAMAETQIETTILPEKWDIEDVLRLILNVVVYGLGVAAVLGVVIAGILYMTARDNEAQVQKAKTRLYEIAIGLVAWALMYGVLNWLIPGGLGGLNL